MTTSLVLIRNNYYYYYYYYYCYYDYYCYYCYCCCCCCYDCYYGGRHQRYLAVLHIVDMRIHTCHRDAATD